MPEPVQPDARRRAALLLYIIKSGVTDMRQLIACHVARLHRQFLLWLREHFQHIPAIQMPFLWQSARQAASKLLPIWLAGSCCAIITWIHECGPGLTFKGMHLPSLVSRKIWQTLAPDEEDSAERKPQPSSAERTGSDQDLPQGSSTSQDLHSSQQNVRASSSRAAQDSQQDNSPTELAVTAAAQMEDSPAHPVMLKNTNHSKDGRICTRSASTDCQTLALHAEADDGSSRKASSTSRSGGSCDTDSGHSMVISQDALARSATVVKHEKGQLSSADDGSSRNTSGISRSGGSLNAGSSQSMVMSPDALASTATAVRQKNGQLSSADDGSSRKTSSTSRSGGSPETGSRQSVVMSQHTLASLATAGKPEKGALKQDTFRAVGAEEADASNEANTSPSGSRSQFACQKATAKDKANAAGGHYVSGKPQLHTKSWRERLPGNWSTGAAWLQGHATSAAAAAALAASSRHKVDSPARGTGAAAALAASSSQKADSPARGTGAAAALAASSSQDADSPVRHKATSPAPTNLSPVVKPTSRHRRHMATASVSMPDQDLPHSPDGRAIARQQPSTLPSGAHNTADQRGIPAAEAFLNSPDLHERALPRINPVAGASPGASRTALPLSGQQSIDQAAAALHALRLKYLPQHAQSSQEMPSHSAEVPDQDQQNERNLSATSVSKPGARSVNSKRVLQGSKPSRSSFGFRSTMSVTDVASPVHSFSRNKRQTSSSSSSTRALHKPEERSAESNGPSQQSASVLHKPEIQSTELCKPSQRSASPSGSRRLSLHEWAHGSQGQLEPQGPLVHARGHLHEVPQSTKDRTQPSEAAVLHSAEPTQRSVASVQQPGAPKQKKCGMLSLSDESSAEVDVYNLQSPGPILLANALGSPLARSDSYQMALAQPGVTLTPWHPSTPIPQASGQFPAGPEIRARRPSPLAPQSKGHFPTGPEEPHQAARHPPAGLQSQGSGQIPAALDDQRQPSEQVSAALDVGPQGCGQVPAALDHQQQPSGHVTELSDVQREVLGLLQSEGQVVEGQGTGQFLGPPAQRWATASSPNTLNRLPSMSPETDAKDSMQAAGQLEAADTLQGSLLAISGSCVSPDTSQKLKRKVRFDLRAADQLAVDQENLFL